MPEIRPLTADDILSLQYVTDAQLSPDGASIAFVAGETFKEKTCVPKSRIWIVPFEAGLQSRALAQPFTAGPRSDVAPRWSPDGQWLAFLSDRVEDGQYQLYVMPRAGGEACALTDVKSSIEWLQWSPDGQHIALLLCDADSEEERKRKEDKDDAIEFEKHHKFTRLWIVDVASRTMRCVTRADVQVWEAEWSPDGRHFALVLSDEPYEWSWYQAVLARVPVESGEIVTLARPVPRQVSTPRWSPDGARIAYLSSAWSDRGVVGGDLYVISAGGGPANNLSVDYRGSVHWLEWTPGGHSLLILAGEEGHSTLAEISLLDGSMRRLWSAPVGVSESSQPTFSRAGDRFAAILEDLEHPRDVWAGQRRGGEIAWTQLTHFNAHAYNWHVGPAEEVRWCGPDGLELQGFLIKPAGYEPGMRYPLVTIVHGGPSWAYGYRFTSAVSAGWAQMLATRGCAVFLPNPRGSFGRGVAFTESNLGDMGGKDMQDILAGVDDCIDRGVADPEALSVAGWSYGGFMAAWIITQSTRFKAAVVGAGITNWLSFHGTSSLSTWDQQYLLASPYERGGAYDRFSPLHYVHRVRTPTLLLHGAEDHVVPAGQAYEFFRALKELGIPVELVLYPREGHGPLERAHRRDSMQRAVEWLARARPAPETAK